MTGRLGSGEERSGAGGSRPGRVCDGFACTGLVAGTVLPGLDLRHPHLPAQSSRHSRERKVKAQSDVQSILASRHLHSLDLVSSSSWWGRSFCQVLCHLSSGFSYVINAMQKPVTFLLSLGWKFHLSLLSLFFLSFLLCDFSLYFFF